MRWIVAVVLVAGAAAQDAGVRVTGVVKDAAMQAIPAARVVLVGPGVRQEQATQSDGHFLFDALLPGRYSVEISATWFSTRNLSLVLTGDGVDLGSVLLEIPCMHCEPPIDLSAPEPDCWDYAPVDAAAPILSTARLARLATVKPLPPTASEGMAEIRILVTPSGRVGCAAAVAGEAKFAAAALVPVRQWRFTPGGAFMGRLGFRSARGRVSLQSPSH